MADPRVAKLAEVMVNYSLEMKPGENFWLRTTPLAEELSANETSAQITLLLAAKTNRGCTGICSAT